MNRDGPMTFSLHPRLVDDTHPITDWPVATVRLMDDARFPWLILVPQIGGLSGLHEMAASDRAAFVEEITAASRALERLFQPERINVAALGNMVPQLHVHVIARLTGDAAWPGPVWGVGTAAPYGPDTLAGTRTALKRALAAAAKPAP